MSLKMNEKKRAHHISAPIPPNYHGFGSSTSDSFFDEHPPPAYQPPHHHHHHDMNEFQQQQMKNSSNLQNFNQMNQFYHPMPPPQTVIIYRQPTRSKDACCWGWLVYN
jgi:hypothetical protein